jgi:hypothetical protein
MSCRTFRIALHSARMVDANREALIHFSAAKA